MAFTYGTPVAFNDPREEEEERQPTPRPAEGQIAYGQPVNIPLRSRLLHGVDVVSRGDTGDYFDDDDRRWGETEGREDSPTGRDRILINDAKYEAEGATGYRDRAVTGESLHRLRTVAPEQYGRLRDAAESSPETMRWARESYEKARGEGEDRSFNDWWERSRFDQVVGGYLFAGDESMPTMSDWDRNELPYGEEFRAELDKLDVDLFGAAPTRQQPRPRNDGLTYGAPVPFGRDPEEEIESDQRAPDQENNFGFVVNQPTPEEAEALTAYYDQSESDRRLIEAAGPMAAMAGMPGADFTPVLIQEMRRRRDEMVDSSYAGFTEDDWWEIVKKNTFNFPVRIFGQVAGMLTAQEPMSTSVLRRNSRQDSDNTSDDPHMSRRNYELAERYGSTWEDGEDPVTQLMAYLDSPEGIERSEREAKEAPIAAAGQEMWDASRGILDVNQIRVRPQSTKYYAAGIMEATLNMAPAIVMTMLTKNPTVGASIMGGQVYGETYASMRDRGINHETSSAYAVFSSAFEILTERIPLGILTRNEFRGLKRILAGAGAEGFQEPMVELLQIGMDMGILHEDLQGGEIIQRLIDAGIMGIGAGASIGASVEGVMQFGTPAAKETAADENVLARIAEEMEERARSSGAYDRMEEELIELEEALQGQGMEEAQVQRLVEQGLAAEVETDDRSASDILADVAVERKRAEEAENEDVAAAAVIRQDELAAELEAAQAPKTVKILPKGRRRAGQLKRVIEKNRTRQQLEAEGVAPADSADVAKPYQARQDVTSAYSGTAEGSEVTDAQKLKGNYEKGRFSWNGMPIAVETAQGDTRSGVDSDGEAWSQRMNSGYGYFEGKPGADQVAGEVTEGVDVYVGEDPSAPMAYVVNQKDAAGEFDEHKVMVGYRSMEEAEAAYKADHAPAREDPDIDIVAMSPNQMRQWLDQSEHKKPLRYSPMVRVNKGQAVTSNEGDRGGVPDGVSDLETEEGTLYSFGDTGYSSERVSQVSLADLMEALQAEGYENFDDAGINAGARIIEKVFGQRAGGPLRVYRLGTRAGTLRNRNAGDSRSLAAHLLRQQSMEGPAVAGGIGDTVTLWEISDPSYDLAPAMHVEDGTEVTADRYRMRGKEVVGSPPKVKSLTDVELQIEDLVAIMQDSSLIPAAAWNWYEDSGAAIRDITQNDPSKAHDVVKVLSVLSQAAGVAGNTTAFIKAAYEIAKGNTSPLVGRFPNVMSKKIHALLEATEVTTEIDGIGHKLVSFYQNLYDATFSTNHYPDAVTVDRWIARLLEYRSDAVLGTQYEYAAKVFQDAVTRYNARNGTDWLPRSAQAAIWVHQRSTASIARNGKETPIQAFSDPIEERTAQVTHEAVPSISSPIGQVIAELPLAEKAEFTQYAMGVIYEGEKNLLLEELGIPLYRNRSGTGGYGGNISPTQITGVLLLKEDGQYDRATADVVAQSLMYIYQQDAVPWFRMDRKAKPSNKKISQGYAFNLESALTPETEEIFFAALRTELGDAAGYTRTAEDQIVVVDFKNETGVAQSQLKPRDFVARMENLANRVRDDLGIRSVHSFGAEGNYLTHDWVGDPNGQALETAIEDYASSRGRPALLQRVRNWRQSAQAAAQDFAEARPRERVAASVPVDRLERGPDLQRAIYGRFGNLTEALDTTEALKFYDLTPVVTQPELVNKLVEDLGFQVEVFSFEPGKVRVPKLKQQNYNEGYLWIYDPEAEHGSFKDTEYTRAWRVSHEAGHGITEAFVQNRYGDSRRYGRLGRPMVGQRGAEGKQVDVRLKPLTLKEAQRAIEWEDIAFRAQRILLREMGIRIEETTFAREYNTNIGDALYRVTTGDFGDPGEYGFVPSAVMPDIKSVLESLQATEAALAESQGREATEGVNLDTWKPVSDEQIAAAVAEKMGRDLAPVMHVETGRDLTMTEGSEIPRNKDLNPDERAIETRFANWMESHTLEELEQIYSEMADSRGGQIISADVMREMSPDYLADRTQSNAVHEPASWLAKQLYARALARPTPANRAPVVMFTAGGTGSGKTSTVNNLLDSGGIEFEGLQPEIIYDTNLANLESGLTKFKQANTAGRAINVAYVWRDPVEALQNGVLPRAERQIAKFGTGRVLGINTHIYTYVDGYNTIKAASAMFRAHPAVDIIVIDNSKGLGNQVVLGSIDDLTTTNLDYNELEGQLYGVLNEALHTKAISQATYDGVVNATTSTARRVPVEDTGGTPEGRESDQAQSASKLADLYRQLAVEFTQHYPNSPDITVVPTFEDLPAKLRERRLHPSMSGVFLPDVEGAQIYLVADKIPNSRKAFTILLHEAVGHYGLRSVLGAEYDSTMDRIRKAKPKQVSLAAKRNGIRMTNDIQRRLAAEEYVAYLTQEVLDGTKPMPKQTWYTDLLDTLKIAVARVRGIQFTDVEAMRLIRKARAFTASPMGLASGALRIMHPPVMHVGAWYAINNDRVPMSAPAQRYIEELRAQMRAGNIGVEAVDALSEWLGEKIGPVDKIDLLRKLRDLGNQEALFHVEHDGRRDAILNGDNTDSAFELEEGSKTSRWWNWMVFKIQDKFINLLDVQKAIEQQTGAPIPDALDAYLQEELFHGRIKHRVDEYEKNNIKPLVAAIRASDYTWDEVEWYLYARHAPEANAQLYRINKATAAAQRALDTAIAEAKEVYAKKPQARNRSIAAARAEFAAHVKERLEKDPGLKALSGMSNAEALEIMDVLGEKGEISQLVEISAKIDAMSAENRRIMVDEGLQTQETIDAWDAVYDYYVPLKGWQDGPAATTFLPKRGKGYDTGGALVKRRLGRRTRAGNILANIVAQHQSTLVMAEKMKVGASLLELAKANPNPALWTVNEAPRRRYLDKKTGLVVYGSDPTFTLRDNVVRVKVEGKDYHITFNENYEPGVRIARAMKNLSGQEINAILGALHAFNRILSAVNTSYNPEFILSNLTRDFQTGMINLNDTAAENVKRKIMASIPGAYLGIRRYLELPTFKNKEKADFWKAEFDEFRRAGGQVGWLMNYKDVQSLQESLLREMHKRDSGLVSWATIVKAGRYIEAENQAVENAIRLAAFHHAKSFTTVERAASIAKNLTVNFNRKGDVGAAMNALYLFANASVQGITRTWQASKNKRVRHVLYGIVAFAAAMDIINRLLAGDDDDGRNRYDKIEPFIRERNLIIMLPERFQPADPESFDDYYITIPLPYGYNFLYAIGAKIGSGLDYAIIGMKRELEPMQGAFELLNTALNTFNPIGTGPTPLQTVLPTVFQPLIQISENTAWHGGPIYPAANVFDPAPLPESQQYFRSAPSHTIALAELLNRLGGGSDVRPAMIPAMDISPETIQVWEDFLTGGAGRFVTNLVELGVMAKEGEFDTRRIPFVRRVVGKTDEYAVSNRFYNLRTEINYAEAERDRANEGRRAARTPEERAAAAADLAQVNERYSVELRLIGSMRLANSNISGYNSQRRSMEGSRRTDEEKEERVEALELRKTQRMQRFNTLYETRLRTHLEERAETSVFPLIKADTRREVASNFRDAGMPAMADLIESLPGNPPPEARLQ